MATPIKGAATLLAVIGFFTCPSASGGDKVKPKEHVELAGTATDYFHTRNWRFYHWREDFAFKLKDDKTGQSWQIISREPTPHYHWRLGPTYTGLKVDWQKKPRVKVVGVAGVDRQPPEFYDYKLDKLQVATALVVWVETKEDQWQEFYVNNWFHRWGDKADKAIYAAYAGKKAPYDIYGYINAQAAPFSNEAKALIARYPKARTFHGLVRAAKDTAFGYEIDLLHLFGPDASGNGIVFYGDPKTVPPLDTTKAKKN